MTLQEAIKMLTDETVLFKQGISPPWVEAVKLGIEALKRIELQRSPSGFGYSYRLPGETVE